MSFSTLFGTGRNRLFESMLPFVQLVILMSVEGIILRVRTS